MKKILLILFSFATLKLSAQQNDILTQIEANNLSLKALRLKTEALCKENTAENTLQDPSIEFAYLWGDGGIRRKDISLSQSIDYATIAGLRKNNILSENELLNLEYKLALRDIRLEANNLISEIIYRNALLEILQTRLGLAQQLESLLKKGVELGEYTIIDYHDAQIDLANLKILYNQYLIEKTALTNDLVLLNAGIDLEITDTELITKLLPKDFELWLKNSNSTTLQYYRKALEHSEAELKLRKGEAVPSINIGYLAELVPESNFRGITLGLNVPLWSASKKIKASKLKLEAAKDEENAAVFAFGQKAKSLYNKAIQLSESISDCSIDDSFISEIQKAMDLGQINIIEYITTIDYYFESIELGLQTKLNYCLTVNELESL